MHQNLATDDLITIADAARLSGRSQSWLRTRRQSGPLVAAEINGKQAVTLRSLQRLLHEIEMRDRPGVRHLRLVVDNTKSAK